MVVCFFVLILPRLALSASYLSGYDLNLLLFQPYPLAGNPIIYKNAKKSKTASNNVEKNTQLPKKLGISAPSSKKKFKKQDINPQTDSFHSGWLSEIRVGLLKHSASISTSTPKEKGVDGSFEILFSSPQFLKLIWSPRPHIGTSVNASKKDTDLLYAGLTWGWHPFRYLFIDASFGLSLHNGYNDVKSTDPLYGRVREFGCDWLFRESLEIGTPISKGQRLSVMWDHVSHGGICDTENEGMDNLGIRYGYKF